MIQRQEKLSGRGLPINHGGLISEIVVIEEGSCHFENH